MIVKFLASITVTINSGYSIIIVLNDWLLCVSEDMFGYSIGQKGWYSANICGLMTFLK